MLFVVVLAVYLLTASYGVISIDVLAAEVPAWSVATRGELGGSVNSYPEVPWFFEHAGRIYSDRFPGAIAYLVPGYWVADLVGVHEFSIVPGAVTAAVTAALAVLVMNEVYGLTLSSRRSVHVATTFTAFGTGVWSVCANAPWSHTIDLLLLALGLWALSTERLLWAGFAFSGVVLTRPHWVVAIVVVGLSLSLLERSALPSLKIAVGTLPGVALLFIYNGINFGRWGPTNGHELGGSVDALWSSLPVNILGGFLSPTRGLIFFYPIVLVCALALPRVLRGAAPWQTAAALGGACGIAVQLLLNQYTGGEAFFGTRLWIEPLVLSAPLLALAVQRFADENPGSVVVPLMLGYGVVIHGVGAILLPEGL